MKVVVKGSTHIILSVVSSQLIVGVTGQNVQGVREGIVVSLPSLLSEGIMNKYFFIVLKRSVRKNS